MGCLLYTTTAGINSVHTYAAHQAVHNIAMAQKSPSTNSSSIDGSSISPSSSSTPSSSRPLPFFMPVSRTPPHKPLGLDPPQVSSPDTSHHSSPKPSKRGGTERVKLVTTMASSVDTAVTSSYSTTSRTTSLSSTPIFPSTFTSPSAAVDLATNPFSYMLLPNVGGTGGGGAMMAPQYAINFHPPHALMPLSQTPFPFPILPNSVPLSLLPTTTSLSSPMAPHALPLSASILSPMLNSQLPLRVTQADLELLTNIQNRISSQLSSMSSSDEDTNETNTRPPAAETSMDQGLVSSLVAANVKLCVTQPPEMLSCTPVYEVLLNQFLGESEHVIERVDNRHDSATSGSGVISSTGPVVVMAVPPHSSSLATAVKFANTAPRLSLIGGSASSLSSPTVPGSPVPTSATSSNPLFPALHFSPLKAAVSSPSGPTPLTVSSYQYLPLLPLLYTSLGNPTAAGIMSPLPHPTPQSFYVLPSASSAAINGSSVGLTSPVFNPHVSMSEQNNNGDLNQQLSAVVAGSAGMVQGGLGGVSSSATPLYLVVPHPSALINPVQSLTPSDQTLQSAAMPPLGVVPVSVARTTSQQCPTKLCVTEKLCGDEESGTKQCDAEQIGTEVSVSGTTSSQTTGRKRQSESSFSTNLKLLKLSSSSSSTDSASPLHVRGITTNQNHPRWSGDTTAEACSSSHKELKMFSTKESPQASEGTSSEVHQQSEPYIIK